MNKRRILLFAGTQNRCVSSESMSRIITVFHQAADIEKSIGVKDLEYQLSKRGHYVLFVDMDSQGSLSTFSAQRGILQGATSAPEA